MNHHPKSVSYFERSHLIFAVLVAGAFAGCSTYSKVSEKEPKFIPTANASGSLTATETGIVKALHIERRDPMAALGEYIAATETAWRLYQRNPHDEGAKRDYNFAIGRIVAVLRDDNLDPWTTPLRVPADGGDYILTHKPDPRPQRNPARYVLTPADQFDIHGTYVSERTLRPGIGAPVVAVGKNRNDGPRARFMPARTYYGVTVVARFEGRRCVLSFEDPLAAETTQVDGRTYPLGADFTVPVAVMLASNDPKKLELARLLQPEKYAETARVITMQPFDPNRTVVLFVHGLADTPATWAPMINTLRGNAEIRKHYQFWFYSYPSGYAYPYAAALMRRELDGAEWQFEVKKIVLVGHSMGGCISRLMITDTGDQLWKDIFQKPPEQVKMSPESKQLFAESLIFRHRPEVERVIFISAPLKGSDIASHWIGRLASSLVRSPVTFLKAGREMLSIHGYQAGDLRLKRLPNSVDTLAPNNRFVKAINTIPITPGIPYHTIVGDRGRGDSPNSSDGVVPYWSSHMDGAKSELVVPSTHSAHQNPQAIAEVRRILLLNEH